MEDNITNTSSLVKVFLKNLILEFLISLFLLFILSILLCTTKLSEDVINPAIIFISALSIMIGSFFSGKKLKSKGIAIGVIQGIMYMLILYMISSISNMDFEIGIESLVMILIGTLGGSLRRNNWS